MWGTGSRSPTGQLGISEWSAHIELLVEAYLLAQRALVAARLAAAQCRPVIVGRTEFDALLGERRKRGVGPHYRKQALMPARQRIGFSQSRCADPVARLEPRAVASFPVSSRSVGRFRADTLTNPETRCPAITDTLRTRHYQFGAPGTFDERTQLSMCRTCDMDAPLHDDTG